MKSHVTGATRRAEVIDAAFVVLLGVISASTFRESFGGFSYLPSALVGVIAGTTVALAAARFKLSVLPTAAIGVIVFVVVVGTVAFRERATVGVLPSIDTVRNALEGVVTGWKDLLTIAPPIGGANGLFIVPALCAFAVGLVSTRAARTTRSTLWVLLPVFVSLTLGLLCGFAEPVSILLHGLVVAVAGLTWTAVREHRRRPVVNHTASTARVVRAALLLAVAGVIGLSIGPSLPLVDAGARVAWRSEVHPPFNPSLYPSPLNGYRRYVKALKDTTLFTVEGLPKGIPIRLATMDAYDGLVWRVSGGTSGTSGLFERVGEHVKPDFEGDMARITFTIGDGYPADLVWMPTVGEVASIEFGGPRAEELAQSLRYNRWTDVAATPLTLRSGDSYTLEVALPHTEDDVRRAGASNVIPQVENDITQIDSVTAFASGALLQPVAEQTDEVSKALKLAEALRTAWYLDPNTDPASGRTTQPSGHGAARLDHFVDVDAPEKGAPEGDAEQFAATAGLVAAAYQIPSRVVIGFVTSKAGSSVGPVAVTGNDAEAWIEVPVEGFGWVGLTVTPDRDRPKPKVDPTPSKLPERQTQVPAPKTNLIPDLPVDASAATPQEREQPDDDTSTLDTITSNLWLIVALLAVASPLFAVGGTGGVIAHAKRRRRRRRWNADSPSQRIAGAWSELSDAMLDHGHPIPFAASRHEAARFCGGGTLALAARADQAVFGPGEPSDAEVDAYWAAVDNELDELKAASSRFGRWKAKANLTSLIEKRTR